MRVIKAWIWAQQFSLCFLVHHVFLNIHSASDNHCHLTLSQEIKHAIWFWTWISKTASSECRFRVTWQLRGHLACSYPVWCVWIQSPLLISVSCLVHAIGLSRWWISTWDTWDTWPGFPASAFGLTQLWQLWTTGEWGRRWSISLPNKHKTKKKKLWIN